MNWIFSWDPFGVDGFSKLEWLESGFGESAGTLEGSFFVEFVGFAAHSLHHLLGRLVTTLSH